MRDHLRQPEELKMADQECAIEHDKPADEAAGNWGMGEHRRFDPPDRGRDRLPMPEQQHQRQARQQHIGAALERR